MRICYGFKAVLGSLGFFFCFGVTVIQVFLWNLEIKIQMCHLITFHGWIGLKRPRPYLQDQKLCDLFHSVRSLLKNRPQLIQ